MCGSLTSGISILNHTRFWALCWPEAILLASFILMPQTRMSHRAEQRDHLMLKILLLTEREITANSGWIDRLPSGWGFMQL